MSNRYLPRSCRRGEARREVHPAARSKASPLVRHDQAWREEVQGNVFERTCSVNAAETDLRFHKTKQYVVPSSTDPDRNGRPSLGKQLLQQLRFENFLAIHVHRDRAVAVKPRIQRCFPAGSTACPIRTRTAQPSHLPTCRPNSDRNGNRPNGGILHDDRP